MITSGCAVCSGSSGCPCHCNYATDSTCQCRDLAQTLNVTITKSAVYASYPLIYQQAFNYQPYEVSIPALLLVGRMEHACSPVSLTSIRQIFSGMGQKAVSVLGVTSTM